MNHSSENKNKRGHFTGIGGASLVMIFAILCLTVFVVLTYLTASNEYNLAVKYSDSAKNFYKADEAAENIFAKLKNAYSLSGESGLREASATNGVEISEGNDGTKFICSYNVEIDTSLDLLVEVALKNDGNWLRLKWNSYSSVEWIPDDQISVFE